MLCKTHSLALFKFADHFVQVTCSKIIYIPTYTLFLSDSSEEVLSTSRHPHAVSIDELQHNLNVIFGLKQNILLNKETRIVLSSGMMLASMIGNVTAEIMRLIKENT